MKTIKELADELGVSKTAVMKKIDNLGLREKLAKNGNRLAIREPEEKLIIEAFSKKESTTANQKPPTKSTTKSTTANQKPPTKSTTANQKVGDSEELISSLLEQLKAKDLQLAKKDEQIEALQNQMIQTTAALLAAQESVKAAQALHAIDRKEDVLAIEGDQEEKDLNRKWWQFWK
jgi:DNA-binding transcriptional regulator GbsR (MarR family)